MQYLFTAKSDDFILDENRVYPEKIICNSYAEISNVIESSNEYSIILDETSAQIYAGEKQYSFKTTNDLMVFIQMKHIFLFQFNFVLFKKTVKRVRCILEIIQIVCAKREKQYSFKTTNDLMGEGINTDDFAKVLKGVFSNTQNKVITFGCKQILHIPSLLFVPYQTKLTKEAFQCLHTDEAYFPFPDIKTKFLRFAEKSLILILPRSLARFYIIS